MAYNNSKDYTYKKYVKETYNKIIKAYPELEFERTVDQDGKIFGTIAYYALWKYKGKALQD